LAIGNRAFAMANVVFETVTREMAVAVGKKQLAKTKIVVILLRMSEFGLRI
jgi:hypothetical protein